MDDRTRYAVVGAVLAVTALAIWTIRTHGAAPATNADAAATVEVVVYDDGEPQPDRIVVFSDVAGSLVGTAKTDADGKASGPAAAGGSVTVAWGTSARHLVTVLGVAPGERVVVGENEDEGPGGKSVTLASALVPEAVAGAKRYTAGLGVGSMEVLAGDASPALPVLSRFVVGAGDAGSSGRFRVLAEAFDPGGAPLAWSFAWGDVGAADAGKVEVKLPAWRRTYVPFAIELANAPAAADVAGHAAVVTGRWSRFERPAARTKLVPKAAPATLRFGVPDPLAGEGIALRVDVAWEGSRDAAVYAERTRGAPIARSDATSVTGVRVAGAKPLTVGARRLDLAADLLARVSQAVVETTDDPARPRVRWTAAAGGAKSDAVVVRISWSAQVWTVVGPPDAPPAIRMPELPPALAAWRPRAAPTEPAVALLESSEFDDYAGVRHKGIEAAVEPIEEDDDGRVRWSSTGDISF